MTIPATAVNTKATALNEHKDVEVFRRSVRYVLPPTGAEPSG